MDKIVDFTNCDRIHPHFGGSDRKVGVIYNGDRYMLKFAENHAKRHDISTSYVNNVISEYISSHIAATTGLPVHQTILGVYRDEIVVACKDFREAGKYENVEFADYVRSSYGSGEINRIIRLEQIYAAIKDPENDMPTDLQTASIERYWDTFVIDALVGNFDRHIGNWGYLMENEPGKAVRLAPVYDFGSTLFPQLSDEGTRKFMISEFKMAERALVFPSPALAITKEKVGKVGYYDMMASNYDQNCTSAVLRMYPKIDLNKINAVIDNTPMISQERKDFYKSIVALRKELILDRAYLRCLHKDFDKDSIDRLKYGRQFSDKDLELFLEKRRAAKEVFQKNEDYLRTTDTVRGAIASILSDQTPDRKEIQRQQLLLSEQYGFHSDYLQGTEYHQEIDGKTDLEIDRTD